MKYKKLFVLVLSIFVINTALNARERNRVKDIRSEKSFDKYARQGLVAALFYSQEKKPRKREATAEETAQWESLNRQNEDLLSMFAFASKDFLYEEGDLLFITINIAKKQELADIAKRYNITQFPTVILFNFGRPIRGTLGTTLMLSGFFGTSQFNAFVKDAIGKKLEQRKKEKAEYRKKRLEEARIRSYYAPYFYWGYPYYGGYPYYWGWGYPYGRYWW